MLSSLNDFGDRFAGLVKTTTTLQVFRSLFGWSKLTDSAAAAFCKQVGIELPAEELRRRGKTANSEHDAAERGRSLGQYLFRANEVVIEKRGVSESVISAKKRDFQETREERAESKCKLQSTPPHLYNRKGKGQSERNWFQWTCEDGVFVVLAVILAAWIGIDLTVASGTTQAAGKLGIALVKEADKAIAMAVTPVLIVLVVTITAGLITDYRLRKQLETAIVILGALSIPFCLWHFCVGFGQVAEPRKLGDGPMELPFSGARLLLSQMVAVGLGVANLKIALSHVARQVLYSKVDNPEYLKLKRLVARLTEKLGVIHSQYLTALEMKRGLDAAEQVFCIECGDVAHEAYLAASRERRERMQKDLERARRLREQADAIEQRSELDSRAV